MTVKEAIFVLECVEAHGLAEEAKRIALEALKEEPTKHGRWIYNGRFCGLNHYKCSVCGKDEFRMSDYCPNCGARMDGITDDVAEEIIKAANKACANCQEFVCDECEYRHWRTR